MSDDTFVVHVAEAELPPEPPPHGPMVWAKNNLFSSLTNTILSVVFGGVTLLFFWNMVGFIIAEDRRWDAVTANMRLLMVQAYPQEQSVRIWLSLAIVIVLATATLAVWGAGTRLSRYAVGTTMMTAGAFLSFLSLIATFHLLLDSRTAVWGIGGLIIGLALAGIGYQMRQGEDSKVPKIPSLMVTAVALAVPIAALWVIQVPTPILGGGQELAPVALSTKLPLTILYLIGIASYLVADRTIGEQERFRGPLVALWALSFPVIVMVILRDPIIPYDAVTSTYLPIGAAFAVVGAVVMWFVADPTKKEAGLGVGALIFVLFLLSWAISVVMIVRILLLVGSFFALSASTFAGEQRARIRYAIVWFASVALITYFVVLVVAESSIRSESGSFLGGLLLTFPLAIAGMALSFPLGVLLALGRTSTMPIFRLLSTAYIEIVRGVPLITWLLVAFVLLPFFLPPGVSVQGVVRAIFAVAFFSAAYLAENIRGGLQSIGKGQYEAAKALGMTTVQMTVFITLPQALRAVIPALVGQVIALFKDTSLVTIVGLFDFLHIARAVIPNQSQPFNFIGVLREPLLFAALVYWIITFSMSRASLRLERKLGLGER